MHRILPISINEHKDGEVDEVYKQPADCIHADSTRDITQVYKLMPGRVNAKPFSLLGIVGSTLVVILNSAWTVR